LPVATVAADVPSPPAGVAPDTLPDDLKVVIGTSRMVADDDTLVQRIANFSDKYEGEVERRMAMGDAGNEGASYNARLMHVALLNGVAVGWCSSSTRGCGGDGHWGALAVDPAVQGRGVASALVKAAEQRLLDAGCQSVQIEYRFTVGSSRERLYEWYEKKLGFDGGPKRSGFRCCHKVLSRESFEIQHARSSTAVHGQLYARQEAYAEQHQQQHESKRPRVLSASSTSSSSSASESVSSTTPVKIMD